MMYLSYGRDKGAVIVTRLSARMLIPVMPGPVHRQGARDVRVSWTVSCG
jgi:hypothetical protein